MALLVFLALIYGKDPTFYAANTFNALLRYFTAKIAILYDEIRGIYLIFYRLASLWTVFLDENTKNLAEIIQYDG